MENAAFVHPVARLRQPEGGEYLLYPGRPVSIGRSAENDVVINDPKISRFHAALDWTGGGFSIRDLGSINGTRVNHEALKGETGRALRDGDEIFINQRVLIFEIVRADSSEPVTEPRSKGSTGSLRRRGPYLKVTLGPDRGLEYPLWGERINVGRASRELISEIRLSDELLSAPHACFLQREGRYILVDLDSDGGTWLNGARLEAPAHLKHGDHIEMGKTCLVYMHNR
jgi:pSer/pThr/pTyr-binding forkhead associated (FHA) protein